MIEIYFFWRMALGIWTRYYIRGITKWSRSCSVYTVSIGPSTAGFLPWDGWL